MRKRDNGIYYCQFLFNMIKPRILMFFLFSPKSVCNHVHNLSYFRLNRTIFLFQHLKHNIMFRIVEKLTSL